MELHLLIRCIANYFGSYQEIICPLSLQAGKDEDENQSWIVLILNWILPECIFLWLLVLFMTLGISTNNHIILLFRSVQHNLRSRHEAEDSPVCRHQQRKVPDLRWGGVRWQREARGGEHLLREAVLQVVHDPMVWGESSAPNTPVPLTYDMENHIFWTLNFLNLFYGFTFSALRHAVWVWEWETSSATRGGSWCEAATLSPNQCPNRPAPCSPAPQSPQVTHTDTLQAHTVHWTRYIVIQDEFRHHMECRTSVLWQRRNASGCI